MIQRIQTVLILLATTFIALFLTFPLIKLETGTFVKVMEGWDVGHSTLINGESYKILINLILSGTAAGFSLISIFLFKKRNIQMALCWIAILFVSCSEGYVYYTYQTLVFAGDVVLTPWNLFSVASVVSLVSAIVFIQRDETLVKSLDRLR